MTLKTDAQDVEVEHRFNISMSFPVKLWLNASYNVHVRSHIR